ncbi:hypothetical protein EE612_005218, partial [Oryza sativa]
IQFPISSIARITHGSKRVNRVRN